MREKGLAKISEFEGASELYAELVAASKRSSKEIRLGRLRAMSADDILNDPNTLYKNIDEWLAADQGRVLFRVANVTGEGMKNWFEEECTRKSGSKNIALFAERSF